MGQWATSGYKPGDVVFFDWDKNSTIDHVGIVEAVSADGKTLTTIEGNTSVGNDSNGGAVMRRQRPLTNIAGAFRPKYGAVSEKTDATEKPAAFAPYTVKITANELNYRSGVGTGFKINGTVKRNEVYTIIEEANGDGASKWGRLKSEAGWINLAYTTRV